MSVNWTTPAGELGVLTEREVVSIPLSATSTTGDVTLSLIAGNLPQGLRLSGNRIVGSPVEVITYTESRFVIRAQDSEDKKDRTFKLSVDGADIPEWVTDEGFLKVGEGESYFVMDDAPVDFQLDATDTDETAGDVIEYYLVPNSGQLPPGLSISKSGRITGFTQPIYAFPFDGDPSGAYDTQAFDIMSFDIAQNTQNGYDSFFYDNQTFDYSENSKSPPKLSRIYTFSVASSDGLNAVTRSFSIYVVTETFLRSDNSIVQVDTNLFRADSSSARKPFWITDPYLGKWRANNYLTLYLDVYDPPSLSGTIGYFISTNPGTYKHKTTGEIIYDGRYEISGVFPWFRETAIATRQSVFSNSDDWTVIVPETESNLPPGVEIDTITGELAGSVPYQAAITKRYTFTAVAVNFPSALDQVNYTLTGQWDATRDYKVNEAVRFNGFIYICIQEHRNQFPSDDRYWALGVSTSERTFSIDLVGEIESAIEWITDSDLGVIKPNQPSKLVVEAQTLIYGGRITYEFVDGKLPPGLQFLSSGLIQGKVIQFADNDSDGLTRFYDLDSSLVDSTGSKTFTTTFDGEVTSFDRRFTFTIKAKDYANVAEFEKTFTILVSSVAIKTFANLHAIALQTKEKRLLWTQFISDATIFRSSDLYRYGDPNFGIQTELKMLMYAGIESMDAVSYVQALSRNHYNKTLNFGDLKMAIAKDPETQEVVYEAIYVEIVDPYERTDGKSINETVELRDDIESKVLVSYDAISIDSDIPLVSDSDHQRIFPNSIKNMRRRIKASGERDREFLPLWMRSIQEDDFVETGYVKALVLCYAKPGRSADIMARIRASEFDFKNLNFEMDRFTIDILDGQIEDKYLAFPQRGEKLP
jgi:hypothetical protein